VILPNFIGPSYTSQARLVDCERSVNLYPERNQSPGAKVPWALYRTPGLTSYISTTVGPGRGMFAQDGRAFTIGGNEFREVFSPAATTLYGNVTQDGNPGQMASSGDAGRELAIASGGSAYIFDLNANTLSAAIAALTIHQIGYLEGYFIGLNQTTSTVYISNLLDGTTWDPAQFVQRSSAPDRWQAILVSGQYIYLFGSETTDVWYDAGAFPFPFAPVPGALLQAGIAAPWACATVSGVPVWLAQTRDGARFVVRANGSGQPTRISTHAVETALRGYTTISDAKAWTFDLHGHSFFVMNFPTAAATWVFDAASEQWCEMPGWDTATGSEIAHPALDHCYAFGKHLVNDRQSGAIYVLDPDALDNAGDPIRRMRRAPIPPMTADGTLVFLSQLRFGMQVGRGIASGQGSDPTVMLRLSRDGGFTWGNELTTTAGPMGAYRTRVVFSRLGRFRDGYGVVELTMSDPVDWALFDAAMDAQMGTT
jgi:hypothetical protein